MNSTSRSDGSESLFCERDLCCVWMDAEAAKQLALFPLRSDRLCDIPRRWKRKRLKEESERPVQRVNGPWSVVALMDLRLCFCPMDRKMWVEMN